MVYQVYDMSTSNIANDKAASRIFLTQECHPPHRPSINLALLLAEIGTLHETDCLLLALRSESNIADTKPELSCANYLNLQQECAYTCLQSYHLPESHRSSSMAPKWKGGKAADPGQSLQSAANNSKGKGKGKAPTKKPSPAHSPRPTRVQPPRGTWQTQQIERAIAQTEEVAGPSNLDRSKKPATADDRDIEAEAEATSYTAQSVARDVEQTVNIRTSSREQSEVLDILPAPPDVDDVMEGLLGTYAGGVKDYLAAYGINSFQPLCLADITVTDTDRPTPNAQHPNLARLCTRLL